MNYDKAGILQDVRTVIDQNQTESGIGGVATDADTLELDDIISKHITTAARHILLNCQLRMVSNDGVKDLPKTKKIEASIEGETANQVGVVVPPIETSINITADSLNKAVMTLPDDYLRLVIAEMDGWDCPVRVPTEDTGVARMVCGSRFRGVRPNNHRPCVIEGQQDGKPALFLYGADEGKAITQAQYLPVPKFDSEDKINLPEMLYEAIIYQTAAMTLQTLGSQLWATLAQMAERLSGIEEIRELQQRAKQKGV